MAGRARRPGAVMDRVLVAAAGLLLVAGINWWFFLAGRRRAARAAVGATGVQQAVVRVKGGFDPARVRVRAGAPARLVFDRREDATCSEEVVFPELGVRRDLPAHQRTTVDLPAVAPGTYAFTCGMGMLRGALVVEEGA